MDKTIIHIKNMVCLRCLMLVKKVLAEIGLESVSIELGVVELKTPLTTEYATVLKERLASWDLEMIEDHKEILVEKIKRTVIDMIRNDANISAYKTSHYLSHYLKYNYTYLANVFSQETGICLTDYIIAHKIEMAKEMLVYEGLTVTEIAWKLNYSSVAHLSNQFNKVTGYRPSQFKKNTDKLFVPLEHIGMLEAV